MQGVNHKGHVSKPPVPEEREANCLRDEAAKKKKDAAKKTANRKRERKEKQARECKIAEAEGAPRPATPESTEEEDSSDVELNFLDDDEAATGAGSPPIYRGAGGEDMTLTLGEARLTQRSLVEPHPARIERFHTGGATRVAHTGSGQQIVQARDGAEVAPAGDG